MVWTIGEFLDKWEGIPTNGSYHSDMCGNVAVEVVVVLDWPVERSGGEDVETESYLVNKRLYWKEVH